MNVQNLQFNVNIMSLVVRGKAKESELKIHENEHSIQHLRLLSNMIIKQRTEYEAKLKN